MPSFQKLKLIIQSFVSVQRFLMVLKETIALILIYVKKKLLSGICDYTNLINKLPW